MSSLISRISRSSVSRGGRAPPPVVVTVRDVTERKRVAATLLATRRQLAESRAAERLRLARELHDGAVQSLLGINYHRSNYAGPRPVRVDREG